MRKAVNVNQKVYRENFTFIHVSGMLAEMDQGQGSETRRPANDEGRVCLMSVVDTGLDYSVIGR